MLYKENNEYFSIKQPWLYITETRDAAQESLVYIPDFQISNFSDSKTPKSLD
jgi:hypothetical protein